MTAWGTAAKTAEAGVMDFLAIGLVLAAGAVQGCGNCREGFFQFISPPQAACLWDLLVPDSAALLASSAARHVSSMRKNPVMFSRIWRASSRGKLRGVSGCQKASVSSTIASETEG